MTLFQHQGLDCEKLNSPSLQAHYDHLTVFIYTRTVLTLCVDVSSLSEGDSSTGTGFRIEWIWSFGPEMSDYNVADIGHVTPF